MSCAFLMSSQPGSPGLKAVKQVCCCCSNGLCWFPATNITFVQCCNVIKNYMQILQTSFPPVLWRCWLGDRKSIWPVESWVLVCWWWQFDWSCAHLIVPVATTSSIILSSNKIQNRDILIPAYPVRPGKVAIKTERERVIALYVPQTKGSPLHLLSEVTVKHQQLLVTVKGHFSYLRKYSIYQIHCSCQ